MGSGSPCASCKLLRRRCTKDCIFAPFFPADDPHKFAIVHKVFGASNVSKMLQELPVQQRGDAVSSLVYEANARMRDPVYGCVGAISFLQNQVSQLQMQLAVAQAEILCIQMQQRHDGGGPDDDVDVVVPPSLVAAGGADHHHHMTVAMQQHQAMVAPEDVDAFLMQNAAGAGAIPAQLMGYGAASAGAMGEPLKRESLWT
ncbi:LOB domain-containing protein 12 [Dichanthelium oligosanthes]|uniref:LOB domain-containing protein 12 n=1 Tax=Dichanthelium oligosanthes TaxID=888268 RepID=A0A1E5W6H2_9POAL|nr:LOB domain-containing protein 12 [Dichanthelium oligosanthes]